MRRVSKMASSHREDKKRARIFDSGFLHIGRRASGPKQGVAVSRAGRGGEVAGCQECRRKHGAG